MNRRNWKSLLGPKPPLAPSDQFRLFSPDQAPEAAPPYSNKPAFSKPGAIQGNQSEMMNSDNWNVEIVKGLSAHFKQPNGPSLPGIDWFVQFQNAKEKRGLLVRQYANNNSGAHKEALAREAMQFVLAKMNDGWVPAPGEPELILMNSPLSPIPEPKPWWKVW